MIDQVRFEGHLAHAQVMTRLAEATGGGSGGLLVDCSALESYDPGARDAFVEWNRDHKGEFAAVAVVTERDTWRMLVSTMSVTSGQRMRAFSEPDEAQTWLSEQIS